MSNVFFTSDLHYSHANIIKYCGRPFMSETEQAEWNELKAVGDEQGIRRMKLSEATVFAHDEAILANINSVVMPGDTLWCLGDFTMGHRTEDVTRWLNRINCKDVRLVRGNHDSHDTIKAFDFVRDYYELKIDGLTIIMSHYPMEHWNHSHHGSFMLHGHQHWPIERNRADIKRLDVGVDGHSFKPWSLAEIKAYMADKGNQVHH